MSTVRVNDILKDRILVSRESAHLLEDALRAVMESARTNEGSSVAPLTVDFAGVAGIAPSFLDELITIFEFLIGTEAGGCERCLIVAHPPTRLSLKFEAVARGHKLSVQALPDGSWILAAISTSARE